MTFWQWVLCIVLGRAAALMLFGYLCPFPKRHRN
jgi:hypothetical protein